VSSCLIRLKYHLILILKLYMYIINIIILNNEKKNVNKKILNINLIIKIANI